MQFDLKSNLRIIRLEMLLSVAFHVCGMRHVACGMLHGKWQLEERMPLVLSMANGVCVMGLYKEHFEGNNISLYTGKSGELVER